MYYIPSAPTLKTSQTPSLLRVYSYGAFLCDRTPSLLSHSTARSYLADIPPRLMITSTSPRDSRCVAQLLATVDRLDESLETSECSLKSPTDGGGLLHPLPSWGNFGIKPGDDSLLIRMGLVPSISQDDVADDANRTSDEDLEIEVFRNTTFDATEWHETSLPSEPRLDSQTWPSCAFSISSHLPSMPKMLIGETSFLASSSSFLGGILASSSSPNNCDQDIPAIPDTTSLFRLPLQSPCAVSKSSAVDDPQIGPEEPTDSQDIDHDLLLDLTYETSLDPQFLFELDFPLLPSSSDAAEFVVENFAFLSDLALSETDQRHLQPISQNIKLSPDAEVLSDSSSYSSLISASSTSSVQSFIIPTFVSVESLTRISLDLPDVSSFPSFPSICSLWQLSPCASLDDLVRIEPPTWCDAVDDGDAFEPLPPDTLSPFHLLNRLDFLKNLMDSEYRCTSLPSVEEESV